MKHTKGKLTVKPSNSWPFDLVTYDENDKEVFRTRMPASATSDKTFEDTLNAVSWKASEREEIKEQQVVAYNNERLRAKSPEMLEALKEIRLSLGMIEHNWHRTTKDFMPKVIEILKELE